MCGICGVIGIESKEAGEAIVRRMMATIVHRGPDEEGILVAPSAAAGIRRLSIIDLPGGSQPIWNEAGTLAVVFNGEIYNFRELRQELEASGHQFRTRSDTETIVHAYEAWGESCVTRLHGMFAFAIVELPQGRSGRAARVFMARDRLGIKPFYYAVSDGVLFFASEVRALLATGWIPAQLARNSISSYLLFGSVGEPMTLVEGVFSLPPGHCLAVATDDPVHSLEPKPYWDIERERERAKREFRGQSAATPASRVRALLEDAVRSHLIADVPVGVFLSSGLDSTALAALASRMQSGIHTFTVAFPDAEFSEAKLARRTAERLNTNHSEMSLSGHEMLSRLEEAVAAFDQPSMDGVNTYFVSWAARQAGLKVALSGLGSDELFGGYSSFRATSQAARLAKGGRCLPRALRSLLLDRFKESPPFGISRDAMRKASAACLDPAAFPHPYFFTRVLFTPQTLAAHLREDTAAPEGAPWWQWLSAAAEQARAMDDFTAVSWLELRSYLANTLLRDTDAMSMRHSLEVRVPFLDSALVECLLALPEIEKRSAGRSKALLVEALRDVLLEEIVAEPKRTFTFPWENWLRGPLGERVAKGLADWSPALETCLNGGFALGVWKEFLGGRTTWSRPWSLYVLNEWVKRNLEVHSSAGVERANTAAISA
jgi:asparagine synthase (glutamine-hydrolysing)